MNKFGKIFVACAAMAAMAAPAFAKDVTLYGSARLATFYEHTDNVNVGGPGTDDTDLRFRLQGNSRLGMRASDGPLGGHVEFGTGVNVRLLYGTYKFDAGTLLVGQAETPYNYLLPSVVLDDAGGYGYGVPYSSRRAQLRYTMDNGFYFAGMDPNAPTGIPTAANLPDPISTSGDDNNVYMPQLVVGFANKVDGFDYNVGVTGLWYERNDFDVVAGMAYIISNIDLGVAKVAVTAHAGQNAGAFLLNRGEGAPIFEPTNRRNVFNAGGSLAVNAFGANVGGAYAYDKPEGQSSDRDKWMAFVNYPVRLAKGFTVVPEFAYYNTSPRAAAGVVAGLHGGGRDAYFAGAKWQIDF